ncbi:MAG: HDOD domain-containing protein [Verrucomicrobiota bacterium]
MTIKPLSPQGIQTVHRTLQLIKTTESVPALSQILEVIQDLSSQSETIRVQELADAITKDISLTSKVLIAANTIQFNHSGQRIHTISEAIQQVGLSEIRNLAVTLLFLSPLQDPLKREEIRNISSIALMSGLIAHETQPLSSLESSEQVLICSTLRYYGRLLISNFFADEIGPVPENLDLEGVQDFYRKKLGASPMELGYHIAASLNLSPPIMKSMEPLHELVREHVKEPDGPFLILASFSMSLCDIIECDNLDPNVIGEKIKSLAKRYEGALKIDYKKVQEILHKAQLALENFQSLYHLLPFHTNFIDRLTCVNRGSGTTSLQSLHDKPVSSTDSFLFGLQEITEMLTSEKTHSHQIYQKIVKIVYEALRLRNCALLMKTGKDSAYSVQEALGQNAFEFRSEFKISLEGRDIFSACLLRADDVLLQNMTDPKIAQHLPAWFKGINPAGTAFLLPIKDQDQLIGVIYGDKLDIGSITFTPDIMRNLKALRNQLRIARKLFQP